MVWRWSAIQESQWGAKVHYNGQTPPCPLFLLANAALRTSLTVGECVEGCVGRDCFRKQSRKFYFSAHHAYKLRMTLVYLLQIDLVVAIVPHNRASIMLSLACTDKDLTTWDICIAYLCCLPPRRCKLPTIIQASQSEGKHWMLMIEWSPVQAEIQGVF